LTGDADRAAVLARALGYPYPRLPGSFLYVNGEAHLYEHVGCDPVRGGRVRLGDEVVEVVDFYERVGLNAPDREPRTAVIGYGSNASPEQLLRKFGEFEEDVIIPTLRVPLVGYDVVYAPLFAYYGSIPAGLAAAPGVTSEGWLQLLTPRQLERVHASEERGVVYDFVEFSAPPLDPVGDFSPEAVHVYLAIHGHLLDDGRPIGLAEIPAEGRTGPIMTQEEILRWARDRLDGGSDLVEFILRTVRDEACRRSRTQALRSARFSAGEIPGTGRGVDASD
jgi:hypothetical protein